jgi:hypothetical protein
MFMHFYIAMDDVITEIFLLEIVNGAVANELHEHLSTGLIDVSYRITS